MHAIVDFFICLFLLLVAVRFAIQFGQAILWLLLGLSVLGGVVGYTQEYGAVVPVLIGGAVVLFVAVFMVTGLLHVQKGRREMRAYRAQWHAAAAAREAAPRP
jgi:hypothetical protein